MVYGRAGSTTPYRVSSSEFKNGILCVLIKIALMRQF